jgi:hypothetical protein
MTPAEQYTETLEMERQAWDRLRSRLPGSPNFDKEVWVAWQATITGVARQIKPRTHPEQLNTVIRY